LPEDQKAEDNFISRRRSDVTKNRCSTLVLSLAIGAFLICAATAQAVAAAGPAASHLTASVRSVQPAVSGMFQVKAPRVWNNGTPVFLDTWNAFQSRTSSASLNKAYAFTTIDGLGHEVLYAGVERASSKSPVVFEFSRLEGERSVGDLRIEANVDNAGNIGTVQFQSYSGDGAKAGLKLLSIAILAGEGCNDAGTACGVANGTSLEVGVNLSQLLSGSEGRFKAVKITTPEDSVVGVFHVITDIGTPLDPFVGGCLSATDSFGSVPNCTSNDINLTAVEAGSCNFTDNTCTGACDKDSDPSDWDAATCGTVKMINCIGLFNITSVTRYDIGLYLSTDGDPNDDFAKSGTCSRNAWTTDSPLTDGKNGSGTDGDTCGDVNAKDHTIRLLIPDTTILCVDSDGDEKVDISHCETWTNGATQISCDESEDVKPGTSSHCKCGILAGACIPFESDDECKENVCELHCGGVAGSETACEDNTDCTAPETCQAGLCRTPICTSNLSCSGGAICLDTLVTQNKTGNCGDSPSGACDAQDVCEGGECVSKFQPSTTACGDAAGQCETAASCTGSSAICPAKGFKGSTTSCEGTSSGGACDGTDSCDGAGACVDGFADSSTVCNPSGGCCDVEEKCTGESADCPTDEFLPATTPCRPSTSACDAPEFCTGNSADCPDDECRAAPDPPDLECHVT
jgi:hypothetical protein